MIFSANKGRRKWSNEEKSVVMYHLGYHLSIPTSLPGRDEIEKLQAKQECLRDIKWQNIKYYVHYQKMKKKML